MTAILQAYLNAVRPLVRVARKHLENGETLRPIAFVISVAAKRGGPIFIDRRDEEAEERSAQEVRRAAERLDADCIFMIMEAWSLKKDQLHRRQEIIERYGSIGASPDKIAVVSFSLETRHGIWTAQAPIQIKGPPQKRTFGDVSFIRDMGLEGPFVHLLPGASAGPVTVH